MVSVAVAGGTGNLGKTLVETIKNSSKHNVIVIARKPAEVEDPGAPIFAVDYTDIETLAKIFAENNVQVVISALSVFTPEGGAAEVALVKASAKSGTVKRFVASDWSFPIPDEGAEQTPLKKHRLITHAELRKTNIEWTQFFVGALMEYWGPPTLESTMPRMNFYLNIEKKIAGLPGDGTSVVAFTYSKDVARMVLEHLDAPKWEESTFAFTEQIALKDFVKMAEEITNEKFKVTYDSIEKMEKDGVKTFSDFDIPVYLLPLMVQYSKMVIAGYTVLPEEKNIRKLYPDIPYLSLRETISMWTKD